MSTKRYDGPVCYMDGWHYSTTVNSDGHETPDRQLYLEDDGSYRYAEPTDRSWHDRTHGQFVTVQLEDGGDTGITVNKEEAGAIRDLLTKLRGGE